MGLMLHCGATEINRADLARLPIPEPMGPRHFPTPFINLVEETERAFKRIGNYDIVKEEYGVTHETACNLWNPRFAVSLHKHFQT